MFSSGEIRLNILHRFYNVFEKLIKSVNIYYCICYDITIYKHQRYFNNLFNDLYYDWE